MRRADAGHIYARTPPTVWPSFRLRFALAALFALLGLGALGTVALVGNERLRATSHELHVVGEQAALDNATWAYLMDFKGGLEGYISATDDATRTELGALIEQRVELIDQRFLEMYRRYPEGSDGWRLTVAQELPYQELRRTWRTWSVRRAGGGKRERRAQAEALAAVRTHGLLMTDTGEASSRGDERVSEEAESRAASQYTETREMLLVALAALLAAGFAIVVWFARSVLPMIERERAHRRDADERAALQNDLHAAGGDREAGAVLAAHLERKLPGAGVVMLAPADEQDALEIRVPDEPGEALTRRLAAARLRDCLAIRHGAAQETAAGDRLSGCTLCVDSGGATLCQPLLVGDKAAGAVSVTLERAITDGERRLVQRTVEDAAPVIAKLRDLSEARTRAATDSLTGTPNRRAFQDEAKRMAAQASRSCEPLAAVLLDLDHFKDVNDTFGHAAGDLVLKFVGACLKGSVRAGDFVARLGGEEFALLLPGTGREGALVLAEHVRQAIAELDVPGVERGITASFGVAVIPDDAGSAEAVVHRADEALYAAKAAGRDCVMAASGGERQILPAA